MPLGKAQKGRVALLEDKPQTQFLGPLAPPAQGSEEQEGGEDNEGFTYNPETEGEPPPHPHPCRFT